jgi:purine-nucleoside phosphorylase
LSERELPVRTLAFWGVKYLILASAAGAVAPALAAGNIVLAREIMDLQNQLPGGSPTRFPGAAPGLLSLVFQGVDPRPPVVIGVHAVVPGPQYETPAELLALRAMGATTVSMSGAAELRAAREEAMDTAMLGVVTNVGHTCHEEVLRGGAAAENALAAAVELIVSAWGLPTDPGGSGVADPLNGHHL